MRPPAASLTPSSAGHLGRSRRRERELRARGEVGVGELLTGLAEVAEALAHRAVLALEPAALGIRQAARPAAAARASSGRVTDRSVPTPVSGSSTSSWALSSPSRERGDRDHEAHAEPQPERGQERAAAPAPELRRDVGEVEHGVYGCGRGAGPPKRECSPNGPSSPRCSSRSSRCSRISSACFAREPAGLHVGLDPLLRGRLDRGAHVGERLALCLGDLGERLAVAQLGEQLPHGDAERARHVVERPAAEVHAGSAEAVVLEVRTARPAGPAGNPSTRPDSRRRLFSASACSWVSFPSLTARSSCASSALASASSSSPASTPSRLAASPRIACSTLSPSSPRAASAAPPPPNSVAASPPIAMLRLARKSSSFVAVSAAIRTGRAAGGAKWTRRAA